MAAGNRAISCIIQHFVTNAVTWAPVTGHGALRCRHGGGVRCDCWGSAKRQGDQCNDRHAAINK